MTTVYVGSARSDERGKANSGKAGDQKSGNEVSKQKWYKHSKGWRVLRCKIPAMRKLIADAMEAACNNNQIGYDQYQRLTLYENVKPFNFNPSKTTKAVETDCSALVRVCVLYALRKTGRNNSVGNFVTSNQASVLLATGLFEELKGTKYTNQADYLMAGDILVTKTKGHTVVVLNNGDKAGDDAPETPTTLGSRILKNGMEGDDVKELQSMLLELGYDLGSRRDDGDFGDATESAVRKFQKEHKCDVDGQVGPQTLAALNDVFNAQGDGHTADARSVRIVGGQCYVRSAPNTSGKIIGTAKESTVHPYQGQTSESGWLLIEYNKQNGWVSGKYGKLEV